MQFSEVGTTDVQVYDSFASKTCGVGYFAETSILERSVLLNKSSWTINHAHAAPIFTGDIDKALRENVRNQRILGEFAYFRAGIEVTVRMNSNQFYFGSLMATMWPTFATGRTFDERAVLSPTVISATTEDSIVKTWQYSYPHMWKPLRGPDVDKFPVNFCLEVLVPLHQASQDMNDSIDVQLWARFVNVELAVPKTPIALESGQAPAFAVETVGYQPFPSITYPKPDSSTSPARDTKNQSTGFATLDAVSKVTLGDVAGDIAKLPQTVLSLLSLFDKPDLACGPSPMTIEPSSDLFLTDVADSSASFTLYRDRYVDPSSRRMPFTHVRTVSEYAQIPGIRCPPMEFTLFADSYTMKLIEKMDGTVTYATPLDYAWATALHWRGSIKLCLMFTTSSFISARFLLQITNNSEFGNDFDADYSDGIAKVIDVKGDTTVTTLLPWISRRWWSDRNSPTFRLKCVSKIASNDSAADPLIYATAWVAGGEDIQFSLPKPVLTEEWLELESAPGDIFAKQFPPITNSCGFDIDNGWCTGESIGTIVSVAKRYSYYFLDAASWGGELDRIDPNNQVPSVIYQRFQETLFGTWRHAFLFRSGGFRTRVYLKPKKTITINHHGHNNLYGMKYPVPLDNMAKLTIPQIGGFPFFYLDPNADGEFNYLEVFIDNYNVEEDGVKYIAARDDLQLGFPILPRRFPNSK